MPLSIDINFTIEEIAKLLVYLAVYITSTRLIQQNGSKSILYLVTVTGAIGAVILMTHKILMLQQVYGVYTPVHLGLRGDRISAPLLNENHMAAFLSLCAAVTIGLGVSTRDHTKKMILFATFALVSASLLLTLSRGGIAAFAAGQIVFISMLLIRRYLKRQNRAASDIPQEQISWVPLALAAALALGLFAAQDAIIGEFLNGDHKKIEILNESLPLIKQFIFTGAGRGTFWVAFPTVSEWGANITFTHAENVIVQFLVDYGAAGLIFIAGFIFLVSRPMLAIPGKASKAGAIAALIAVGVHNLVDFNLEIPAVAVIATAILATVAAPSRKLKRERIASGNKKRRIVPGWIMWLLAALTLFLSAVIFVYTSSHMLEKQQIEAANALKTANNDYFTENGLKNALTSHPADYYIPLMAGVYFYNTEQQNPLPFLAHAAKLNKFSGAPHLYIGRYMLRHGHFNQGLLEMRLAATLEPRFKSEAAKFLISVKPDFEILKTVAVTEYDKFLLWDALAAEFAAQGKDVESGKADAALLLLKKIPPGALVREADRMIKAGQSKKALELAKKLQQIPRYKIKSIQLQAAIFEKAGNPQKAADLLKGQLKYSTDDYALLHQLIWIYQNSRQHEKALAEVKKLRSISTTVSGSAAAIRLEGDVEKAEGNFHMALSRYRQASALMPDNIVILSRMVQTARLLGDAKQEENALERLKKIDPDNKQLK
jgi:tetratricopeptide (TPR) repeat protein/O-antigen ligase